MGAKNAGTEALVEVANELAQMAKDNPCGWSQGGLMSFALALKAVINMKNGTRGFSREGLARFLGVDPRTVTRRVKEGRLPRPKRDGQRNQEYDPQEVNAYLDLYRKND